MKIAVIGAGSGGLALCYELKRAGHSVRLWNRSPERLAPILAGRSRVLVEDPENHITEIAIDSICPELGDAMDGADAAVVVTPSSAHEDLGQRFGEIRAGNCPIILMPGRTYGSYAFTKLYRKVSPGAEILCLETQTILHACRSEGDKVRIYGTKSKVSYTSPIPLPRSVQDMVSSILPCFEYVERYFDVALNNVGAFFHPIPTILNSGWIESGKRFKHYSEGITPRIAAFIDAIDQEKKNLCQRIGVRHLPLTDWLKVEYGAEGQDLYTLLQNVPAYKGVDAPTSLDHRYIFDDLNTGLVPLYRTAEHFGVPMPTLKVFLDFTCAFLRKDYYSTGRGFPAEYWRGDPAAASR